MAGKKHTAEQIVATLRQIEGFLGNGKTTPQACRETGITIQTIYKSTRVNQRKSLTK